MKIGIYCHLIVIFFLQNFYRNVPWVVLYQTYLFCYNLLIWLVTMATNRQKLQKIKKNSSEAVCKIKLKFCSIVSNFSLYKKSVFYCSCSCILVAMATKKFPLTCNGKTENWDLLLSYYRYFDKSFTEQYRTWILSKLLNLIGCYGNRKDKFMKKYSKIISSEAIRGMKLKLCGIVHNISLYKSVFVIAIAHVLSLLWQLKVSIDLYEKSESRSLLLSHCSYFDRTFFL